MGIIFHNSKFINEDKLILKSSNRAFNYGDGFFESIKVINSKPFNFSTHYSRYKVSCNILKINIEKKEEELFQILMQLIQKNKILHGNAKIHISRSGKGKYLPNSYNSEILVYIDGSNSFQQNTAISLCIFFNHLKSKSELSNIKSINWLTSILAAIYANESGFDNAILKKDINKDEIIKLEDVNLNLPKEVVEARNYQYNLIN